MCPINEEDFVRLRISKDELRLRGVDNFETNHLKKRILDALNESSIDQSCGETNREIYNAIQNLTLLCSNFFSILTTANADQLVLMEREYEAHKDYSATETLRNIGEILMKTSIIKATHLKKVEPAPCLTLDDLAEREGALWKYLESIPREKAQNFLDKMANLNQKKNQSKKNENVKKPLPDKSKGRNSTHDFQQQELI